MTRRSFADSWQRLGEARRLMAELPAEMVQADLGHVALFVSVVLLAADRWDEAAARTDFTAAQGMLDAWEGCKASALGTERYQNDGGPSEEALGWYRQAAACFERGLHLLEEGLGADHPDLAAPLGDYGGVLRALDREGEADRILERVLALPPSTLSPGMIGGGYPIIMLDPFGKSPMLPSEWT